MIKRAVTIIPNTHNLKHITPIQIELIHGSRLICPQNSNFIVWMDIILRIIVLDNSIRESKGKSRAQKAVP